MGFMISTPVYFPQGDIFRFVALNPDSKLSNGDMNRLNFCVGNKVELKRFLKGTASRSRVNLIMANRQNGQEGLQTSGADAAAGELYECS